MRGWSDACTTQGGQAPCRAARARVGERGSGDGRTAVIYASPGTTLAAKKEAAAKRKKLLILDADDQLSLRAFNEQYAKVFNDTVPEGDPLANVVKARSAERPRRTRRVPAAKYGLK